ncbi:MAG: hypothetical protein HY940_04570 [Gammaproteobacteria bacterium]|nr:hypothetical protein [Gammaproteobacteria bacterium]
MRRHFSSRVYQLEKWRTAKITFFAVRVEEAMDGLFQHPVNKNQQTVKTGAAAKQYVIPGVA